MAEINKENYHEVNVAARSLRVAIETIQLDSPTEESELNLRQAMEYAAENGLTIVQIADAAAYGRTKAKQAIAQGSHA